MKNMKSWVLAPLIPGTPSLGGEGAASAHSDIKSRAIARKRNTYGQALGDVLLESGKTVEADLAISRGSR